MRLGQRRPMVVVRSCFWANAAKDEVLSQACKEAGGIFVDAGPLGQDAANQASSERSFTHDGVAGHPGDKGMKALADAIVQAVDVRRFDTASDAIAAAPAESAVLIVAEGYPTRMTDVPEVSLRSATAKQLRLYLEYPRALPGRTFGPLRRVGWERAVVATDFFGPELPAKRILAIHDCHVLPTTAPAAPLVLARVAGFDTAVYGLPEETVPLLFEQSDRILIATTCLSRFVTGRYAPVAAWEQVWTSILEWLLPDMTVPELRWTPSVRPSYAKLERLPPDVERQALRRGVAWYESARMLIHPAWADTYDTVAREWPDRVGPGPTAGQPCGDGSLGVLEGFSSHIGLDGAQPVRWWRRHDCNGEAAGGMALAARALTDSAWATRAANLRIAGTLGFQPNRIDEPELVQRGWRAYHDAPTLSLQPHYQAHMWACHLWAYRATGYRPFLDRAKTAIRMTMNAYPHDWRWTNGIQQERAVMLLSLAWLVRLEDTPEHRGWMHTLAGDLLEHQAECGAIREELGPPGDAVYANAENQLARFLCRIQVRSEVRRELDGAWFRAFDFERWEHWASNADAGWGAWCVETGWTQGWIVAVLALRELNTSLWDLTAGIRLNEQLEPIRRTMFPDHD
jgi:hypothetical protein